MFNVLSTSSTSASSSLVPSLAQATTSLAQATTSLAQATTSQPVEKIQAVPSSTSEATHRGIGGALAGALAGGVIAVITACAIMILVRRRNACRAAAHPAELVPTPFAQYSWSERGLNTDSMSALPTRADILLPKAARHHDRRGRVVGTAAVPLFRHAAGEKGGALASTPALTSTPMRTLEAQMAHEISMLRTSIREMEHSQRASSAGRRTVSTIEGDAPPDYDDAIPF